MTLFWNRDKIITLYLNKIYKRCSHMFFIVMSLGFCHKYIISPTHLFLASRGLFSLVFIGREEKWAEMDFVEHAAPLIGDLIIT